MFSEHYDSRKAHEAGFDAYLRELWQRRLGRPASEIMSRGRGPVDGASVAGGC
jgi:hypothetical protein